MTERFEAPIDRVFDLVIDFPRYPEWNPIYTDMTEVVGPPDQVGTRMHGVMKFLGRRMEGWGEIAEIERPRHLKVVGSSKEGGTLTTIYHLTPVGTATEAEFEAEYELPAGLFGQIADKLFVEKAVERSLKHAIENFKALVETPVPVLA
jgi:uncharacterized membrane protein